MRDLSGKTEICAWVMRKWSYEAYQNGAHNTLWRALALIVDGSTRVVVRRDSPKHYRACVPWVLHAGVVRQGIIFPCAAVRRCVSEGKLHVFDLDENGEPMTLISNRFGAAINGAEGERREELERLLRETP